ncbi:head maturation protease [Bacillus phage Bobb]|uniref:Prohead protease n=3 Tax=Agatevirus TaxID=1910931 RepID=A0A076G715_9CAUD|nr:head maturation protease [Bacillus phage Bobb]AII28097.1 prohead protease [Bacillus phage Bobb]
MEALSKKVEVFVPIDLEETVKKNSADPQEKSWYLKGYATTPDLDLQDDIVDPKGLSINYFIEQGYLNYEHERGKDFIIGVPTENCYVDDVGLFIEGKLYKGNPYAVEMWNHAQEVKKSGIHRPLGFSIEGFVKKRDPQDKRIIRECMITNVAVTTNPANPQTGWEAFAKSFITGYEISPDKQVDAAALRVESFGRSIHNLAQSYKYFENKKDFETMWKDVGSYLDAMGRTSPESAVVFLQLAKGMSRTEAIKKVDQILRAREE